MTKRGIVIPAALLFVGLLGGLGVWGGFETSVAYISTNEYCTSCHEMKTAADEYQQSTHFKNVHGVRAQCTDCHMPKPFFARVVHMIGATHDLVGHVTGIIDTPEKYEARRITMAKRVWDDFDANSSLECRSCHAFGAMDLDKQSDEAHEQMPKAADANESCMDCHRGLVHGKPDMSQGIAVAWQEIQDLAKSEGASGDTLYAIATKPMFIERPEGQPEGNGDARLLALSEVKVLERQGDWLKVRVTGWQQEGAERVFYALRGQRILVAALGNDALAKVEQLGAPETDPDTEIVWHHAAVTLWTGRDQFVAELPKLMEYGSELYNDTCSACHSPHPTDYQLANQWIGALNAMKDNISLDDEQYRFLQKYLQLNARDTGGAS